MDGLKLLRDYLEWGADEALVEAPRDRLAGTTAIASGEPALPDALAPAAPTPTALLPAPIAAVARAEAAAAVDTLEALRAAIAGFTDCALAATAIQIVFADQPGASGVLLLGDTPGEAEDRSGVPFSGPGGALLMRMLRGIGLDRETIGLAYAVPWRPPGNRKPSEHERALCRPFLLRLIALHAPRALVLLGTAPAATLFGGSAGDIKRLRGKWHNLALPGLAAQVPTLASCHPDRLLTAPAQKPAAWADLITLRLALDAASAPLP